MHRSEALDTGLHLSITPEPLRKPLHCGAVTICTSLGFVDKATVSSQACARRTVEGSQSGRSSPIQWSRSSDARHAP